MTAIFPPVPPSIISLVAEPDTWSEPIDLFGEFEPPMFPDHLLVPHLREWAQYQSDLTGADKAGYIMSALTVCSGAIPDHVKLVVNEGSDWEESPRMWTALLGLPSAKKSPILKTSTKPLVEINHRYRQATEEAEKVYGMLAPDEARRTDPPAKQRLIIEDVTVEATQQLFKDNPGGLFLLQDELSGFFGAIDKYNEGKGSSADRSYWLKAFNGQSHAVDRVGRGNIYIPHLSACMLGGIQPEPIKKIASGLVDDGLIQRLFVIVLRTAGDRRPVSGESRKAEYAKLIERLHYESAPKTHYFTEAAQKMFSAAEVEYEAMAFGLETTNLKLATHIGKFAGMLSRLVLTLHYIENTEPLVMISDDTLTRAKYILDRFLLPQSYSFYARILEDTDPDLIKVAGYILAHEEVKVLTVRDVVRGRKGIDNVAGQKIFQRLASVGWVRELDPRPGSKVPKWEPNPLLHQKFYEIAKQERERRAAAHDILINLSKEN